MIDQVLAGCDEVAPRVVLGEQLTRQMPSFAILTTATHVRDGIDTASLEPGQNFRIEIWVERDAVSAVTFEQRRIASVQLQVASMHYRERNHRSIVARRLHFLGYDVRRIVVRTDRQQVRIRDAVRPRIISVVGWRFGPRSDAEHDAGHAGIGRVGPDLSSEGKGNGLGRGAACARVRNAQHFADAAVEEEDVVRIRGDGLGFDHRLGLRNYDLGVREVGIGDAGANDLEPQRTLVRGEVNVLSARSGVGHFVIHVHDLVPGNVGAAEGCYRRRVECDLVLDAVCKPAERVG